MKKFCIILTIFALVLCNLSVFAWSVEQVDWTQVQVEIVEESSSPSDWAEEEITKAEDYGLIPSLTDNPGYQDVITREQFAELVVCLMETALGGELDVPGASFDDCNNPQVLKAYGIGVVNGIGDNLFDPKSPTNREEIATMLYRAINVIEGRKGKDITPLDADISAFADQNEVSDWAIEGVGTLAANGLMKGTSATTLAPKEPCTVEQSIALATRIFEQL